MKRLISKNGLALLAVLAVAVMSAVGAYAYFTSTGTGSGSATVGTSTEWEVTTDAAVGGVLTPGGLSSNTIAYHVKNNSAGQQSLANVAISIANADGTPWTSVSGCSKDDFKIGTAAAGATFNDVAAAGNLAPGATANGSITLKMVDTGSNQDGCKDATVPLYLAAS